MIAAALIAVLAATALLVAWSLRLESAVSTLLTAYVAAVAEITLLGDWVLATNPVQGESCRRQR